MSALAGTGWGGRVALFLIVTVVTSAVGVFVVLALPADHFSHAVQRKVPDRHPIVRWTRIAIKTAVGVTLLLLGVLMSLPGVPGPGFVLILVALSLLDFPGKRRLERKLLTRPSVLNLLNDVRARFGKPPLIIDA
jgi:archaellum biogenesis protein FlaJ (TadC family)